MYLHEGIQLDCDADWNFNIRSYAVYTILSWDMLKKLWNTVEQNPFYATTRMTKDNRILYLTWSPVVWKHTRFYFILPNTLTRNENFLFNRWTLETDQPILIDTLLLTS